MSRYYLSDDSWVEYGMLPNTLVYDFEELWKLHPEGFGKVVMFGKLISTPRWQQSYERGYDFSGIMHDPLPLPDAFAPFKEWVNSIGFGTFNQVLINWYQDGTHYIGKHADSAKQLVPNSPIVSISLGAERLFRIRPKSDPESVALDHVMKDRTYLVMGGAMQKEFTHEVPKIGGKKALLCGRRINITFRQFKE